MAADAFLGSFEGRAYTATIESAHSGTLSFFLSTVQHGDMGLDSTEHRTDFFSEIGVDRDRVVAFRQTHSRKVADVVHPLGAIYNADGAVTDIREAVLSVTVGDCLPIVLFDVERGCFGLVHSGWQGTGIVTNAIERMSESFGSSPSDIRALIGPGIGPCCYDVPLERAELFTPISGECVRSRDGRTYLDLKEANRALLHQAGVIGVALSGLCTSCTPELGSFRRQGADGFTRMLAVAGYF